MKREKFESISAKAEQLYQHNPKLYRTLLASMAIFGYAYILLILMIFLFLFVLLLILMLTGKTSGGGIRVLIVCGILVWLIVHALWVKFTPPHGLGITAREAPWLFKVIEEVCGRLNSPRVAEVILDGTFNAGVSQLPRLGIFGWHKNYLTIGLPLLYSLSPEQFKAVLAHEFGHLSGSHGKFSIWIYRVTQIWQQVIGNFSGSRNLAVYLFLPFYKWFAPRFLAFAYVQNRQHEFEADQRAAQLIGKEHAVNALVRTRFYGELFEDRFWPGIYKLADSQASIPAPYEKLGPFVQSFDDYIAADFMLRRAFQQKHEGADSHPVLAERIAAIENSSCIPLDRIEQFVRMCLAKEPSAAEICFNGQRENLTAGIDALWQKMLEADWAQRHVYMQQRRSELTALENKIHNSPLSADESIQLAQLTESIHGPEKALPLYQQLAQSHPDNMQMLFSVGRLLLEKKDPAGQPMIERVMEKAPTSRQAGCELLAKFHYDLGDLEAAKQWRFKMEDEYDASAAVEQERANITAYDKFLPHGLDTEEVKKICDSLAAIEMPFRACLAKKAVKLSPDEPCYVLVAHRIMSWWQWSESGSAQKKNHQLLEQLIDKIRTPLNLYIFVEPQPAIYKKIKKIKGAHIFTVPK